MSNVYNTRPQGSGDHASGQAANPYPGKALELAELLEETITEEGHPFVSLVEKAPILLVFLRHAGCTFCREAMGDIAKHRAEIEATGVQIILVHMGDRAEIKNVITKYGLADLERICDISQQLYEAFGLKKGNVFQLFGLKIWWRGFVAGVVRGHGAAKPVADATQMPGVFLVEQGLIAKSFRHRSAADRPSYIELSRVAPEAGKGEARQGLR